jgi:hypothetical protein
MRRARARPGRDGLLDDGVRRYDRKGGLSRSEVFALCRSGQGRPRAMATNARSAADALSRRAAAAISALYLD